MRRSLTEDNSEVLVDAFKCYLWDKPIIPKVILGGTTDY